MAYDTDGIPSPDGNDPVSNFVAQILSLAQGADTRIDDAAVVDAAAYQSSTNTNNNTLWGVGVLSPSVAGKTCPGVTAGDGKVTLAPGWYEVMWRSDTPVALASLSYMALRTGSATGPTVGYAAGVPSHFSVPLATKFRIAATTEVFLVVSLNMGSAQVVTHGYTFQRLGDA